MKKDIVNYAKLLARVGAKIEKGQNVVIYANVEEADFITLLTKECYLAGAGTVEIEWNCDALQRLAFRYEESKVLAHVTAWEEEKMKFRSEQLPVLIKILSSPPNAMQTVDKEKLAYVTIAKNSIAKKYQDKMTNHYQWCVAAVPSKEWAKFLFPHERASTAVQKLWKAILKASHAYAINPIAYWTEHNKKLHARCATLNKYNIQSLQYRAKNGTDFTIDLIDSCQFIAGKKYTIEGKGFNPNIPSEECFTTPHKFSAQGKVVATKPLVYNGDLIEDFYLVFEKGKVIEFGARKNQELLAKILSMDEGASYLGEVALVSQDSPIQQMGLLFYNTLFDENASCHLALGKGYTNTFLQFDKLDKQDFLDRGVNDSSIHIDFMIGCDDLEITARTKDEQEIMIFKDGYFVENL